MDIAQEKLNGEPKGLKRIINYFVVLKRASD